MKVVQEYENGFEVTKNLYDFFRLAVSKDKSRVALNFVYYDKDNKNLVVTNGHILLCHNLAEDSHSIKIEQETGLYYPVKIGKAYTLTRSYDQNMTFPKYNQVIPDITDYNIFKDKFKNDSFTITGKAEKDSGLYCEFVKETGICINWDYWQLLKYGTSWKLYYKAPDKPMYFSVGTTTRVIIAPMQYKG